MIHSRDYIRKLADEALDTFWQFIGQRHAEAKTGDLSPISTIRLQDAAEDAIDEWLVNNAPGASIQHEPPSTHDDGHIALHTVTEKKE